MLRPDELQKFKSPFPGFKTTTVSTLPHWLPTTLHCEERELAVGYEYRGTRLIGVPPGGIVVWFVG